MEESSSVSDSDSDSDSVSYSKSSMLTSSMRFRARNSPSLLTFIRTPPAICDFWPYFQKLQRSYKHTFVRNTMSDFSKSFTRNMNLEEPHLNAIGVKIQTLLFPVFIGIIQKPHCLYITKICINHIRSY